ncbi:RNA recognition motif domain [Phaffia rhodozyma]|uniref:RNA recognition motif domain n=1 Tax=Phaffia rhodozyma TaxID=264483 RepID=A0A0F7SX14_PHARH|nr:RNA recognition motif domain [Phaffia rhodozyma]
MPSLTRITSLYPYLNLRLSFGTFRSLRVLQERPYTSRPLVGPHRPPSLDDLELDPIDQDDSARASPIFVNRPPPFDKNDYLLPSMVNKTEPIRNSRSSEASSRHPTSYTPWNKSNDKHIASAPLNTNNVSEEKARELCNILIEHLPPQMTKRELKALFNELDIRVNSIVKIQNGRAFVALNGEHSLQRILALDGNLTLMQKKVLVTQIGPLKSSWRFTMDLPRDVTPEDIKKVLQPLNVDILYNKKLPVGEPNGDKRVLQNDKGFLSRRSHRTSIRDSPNLSYGIRKYSTNVSVEEDDEFLRKGRRVRRPTEDIGVDPGPLSEDSPRSSTNHPSSEESPAQHSEIPTSAFSTDTNLTKPDPPSSWESINNSVFSSNSEPTGTTTEEERLVLKRVLAEALKYGKNKKAKSDVTSVAELGYEEYPAKSENVIMPADDSNDDKAFDQLTIEAEQRLHLEKIRDDNLIYQLRVDGFGSQWRYKDLMSLIQEYEIDCSIPTGPQNGLVLMSVVGKHRFEKLFRMAGLEMLLKLTLISCSTTVADLLVALEMAQLKRDHLLENLGINIGKIWTPMSSDGRKSSPSSTQSKNPLQMIVPQYRPNTDQKHYAVHPDAVLNNPPTVPYHPPFLFPDDDPHFGRLKEGNKRFKSNETKNPRKPISGHSAEYTKSDNSKSDSLHKDR